MASLSDIYIKIETLETILNTVKKKGEKGISITVSINDEPNQYDQNVTAFVSQTKEQREKKVNKFYVGNGKTFWTKGSDQAVYKSKQAQSKAIVVEDNSCDEMPF